MDFYCIIYCILWFDLQKVDLVFLEYDFYWLDS